VCLITELQSKYCIGNQAVKDQEDGPECLSQYPTKCWMDCIAGISRYGIANWQTTSHAAAEGRRQWRELVAVSIAETSLTMTT